MQGGGLLSWKTGSGYLRLTCVLRNITPHARAYYVGRPVISAFSTITQNRSLKPTLHKYSVVEIPGESRDESPKYKLPAQRSIALGKNARA